MRLTRWMRPTLSGRDWLNTQDGFSRLMDELISPSPITRSESDSLFAPPADIHETAEAFVVRMDLPGVAPADVKVSMTGDVLVVRGSRKEEKSENGNTRHRIERVHGSFERLFQLGAPVATDKIQAKVRDGVLEITVPKAESAKVREIEVQAS